MSVLLRNENPLGLEEGAAIIRARHAQRQERHLRRAADSARVESSEENHSSK